MMRSTLFLAFLALFATASIAQDNIAATLFKNAGCKCCDHYADYLKANGFSVTVIELPNMSASSGNTVCARTSKVAIAPSSATM